MHAANPLLYTDGDGGMNAYFGARDPENDIHYIRNGTGTHQENLMEYAARLCYRSTHKMGKAPNFLRSIIDRSHLDVTEHTTITLRLRDETDAIYSIYAENRHLDLTFSGSTDADRGLGDYLITANARVWLDLLEKGWIYDAAPILKGIAPKMFQEIMTWDSEIHPPQPNDVDNGVFLPMDSTIGNARVLLLGYSLPDFEDREHGAIDKHGSATFLVEGISRACSHQFVRHRLASFSQESQRYTNYNNAESNLPAKIPALPKPEGEKRHGHCIFYPNQEKFIAAQYASGVNCEELGEQLSVHSTTIRDIVMRNGGSIRNNQEASTMHVDNEFFDEIDWPIKAQMLGLIYADGNVAQRDGVISHADISQHSMYKEWLARVASLWGGNVISGGRENSSKATIPGKRLAQALVNHGVVPAKSKVLTPPDIPEWMNRYFIRGYIEGDGHFGQYSKNPRVQFCGTEDVVTWIRDEISGGIGRPGGQTVSDRGGDHFSVDISGKYQATEVVEWLYEGFSLRYAHPGKLARAIEYSDKVDSAFKQGAKEWADEVRRGCSTQD